MKSAKRELWRALIGSMLLASGLAIAACATDAVADEGEAEGAVDGEVAEEEWTVLDPEEVAQLPNVAPSEADPGVPGEEAEDSLAGCTHIQWCNEPGPVGTVCIWDACSLGQAVAECTSDANYVCGGITQPAHIR
jgi:hypothetical protein